MREEKIIILIDKEGNPSIEVEGVKGKKCLDLTKELEDILGVVKTRTPKKEMAERPVVITTTQTVKRS
jgi:hypothetical protein